MKSNTHSFDIKSFSFPRPPRVLVIESRFYTDISDLLLQGASGALMQAGASVDRISVPGALEIPAALRIVLEGTRESGRHPPYDAFVALGCVIRGETTHYDLVAGESARGLTDLGAQEGLAIGNGILTVETREQAIERADPARLNKGGGAALAALALLSLRVRFGKF